MREKNQTGKSPRTRKRSGSILKKDAILAKAAIEAETKAEWVELFPHGISVGSALGRPVLILKDKAGAEVMPVWMQPLDAGVALAELSHSAGSTPHNVTRRLLETLGWKIEMCTFTELVGHHQFVNITLSSTQAGLASAAPALFASATECAPESAPESAPVSGAGSETHPELKSRKNAQLKNPQAETRSLRVRADEAMSFCLQGGVRFFSTKSLMARCRSLDADLSKLEENLVHGHLPQLTAEMEISSKKHPYVM